MRTMSVRPLGRWTAVSLGSTLLALAFPASTQPPRPAALRSAPAFTAKQLTAWPRDGWITNGGNLFNQRYSPLTQINRDTVERLKPSWRVSLNGSGVASKYSGQGQPIVHDGVIYLVTGADDVFAIDVATGAILWTGAWAGVGFLFGERRYVRLYLEGMIPEQRAQFEQVLAEHVPVRRPLRFTLMTLLNSKGELVARGRLYLFDNTLLCTENRGEKRVFLYAPLKDLDSIKQRASFYVGNLECEAFTFRYRKEHVIMLGYETTFNRGIGNSSHWSVTGNAAEWVEAIEKRKDS